jgi:hypothetical protein
LVAAEHGIPADMAAIIAFNEHRYRGFFSAINALNGDATGAFWQAHAHPAGLPGPLVLGVLETFYEC